MNVMRLFDRLLAAVFSVTLALGSTRVQSAVADRGDPLAAQVAAINRSLESIAKGMADMIAKQKTPSLVQQLDTMDRDIAFLEGERRRVLSERDELENQATAARGELIGTRSILDNPATENRENMKIVQSNVEAKLKRLEERLEVLKAQAQDLESTLAKRRLQQAKLNKLLDTELSPRP